MSTLPKEDSYHTILKLEQQVRMLTEDRNRTWNAYQHLKPLLGARWLIEIGSPALYYCGPGDWCSNPNHALQFAFKDDAVAVSCRFKVIGPDFPRAVEHLWLSSDSDPERRTEPQPVGRT